MRNLAASRARRNPFETPPMIVRELKGRPAPTPSRRTPAVPRRGQASPRRSLPPIAKREGLRDPSVRELHVDPEVAKGLVASGLDGGRHGLLMDEVLRLAAPTLEEHLARLADDFARSFGGYGDRPLSPKGVFIQLNSFAVDPTENHRAESSVSHGQGLFPPCCWRGVVEDEGLRSRESYYHCKDRESHWGILHLGRERAGIGRAASIQWAAGPRRSVGS